MYLLEVTILKRGSKEVDPSSIDISLLVAGVVDLVKVPQGEPKCPDRWFLVDELGEECIFGRGGGRTIHGGDLEAHIGSPNKNYSRKAMISGVHVGNID